MIAGRIAGFFRDGAQVMEKDGTFRPIRYGDIVILLRAVDRKAPLLLQALRDQNIPAVCSQTDDFFASTEVQILWALLRIIDNPRQDLALAAVLRSYFVGLDEESSPGCVCRTAPPSGKRSIRRRSCSGADRLCG